MELVILFILMLILLAVIMFGFFIVKSQIIIAENIQLLVSASSINGANMKRAADNLEKIVKVSGH